jgi:Transport and Golgi organisation 2
MCTISFLPMEQGFALAMNRDEKKSRVRGEKPRKQRTGRYFSLHPSEPGGGTWIGINHRGLALALINWHAQPLNAHAQFSRGIVVPHFLAAENLERAAKLFASLPLDHLNPFRLIAVSLSERAVAEGRWDGNCLNLSQRPWARAHWFSSGRDEAGAARARAKIANRTLGTVSQLRRLHCSHQPERGAFSVCMHRDDAETVSYTEVLAGQDGARMRHAAGALCKERLGAPSFLSFRAPLA